MELSAVNCLTIPQWRRQWKLVKAAFLNWSWFVSYGRDCPGKRTVGSHGVRRLLPLRQIYLRTYNAGWTTQLKVLTLQKLLLPQVFLVLFLLFAPYVRSMLSCIWAAKGKLCPFLLAYALCICFFMPKSFVVGKRGSSAVCALCSVSETKPKPERN